MSSTLPSWDLFGMFLAVMEGGSLSAAARAMNVAQPTVRRQIEALERTLGTPLFTRSQSGLRPTSAAHELLPYAETMAATAAAGLRTASSAGATERGTVRITCSEVLGVEVLPPILVAFQRAHQGIQIELAATNVTEDLVRRDADIAIRMARPQQSALVAQRVATVEVGLFATPECLQAFPPPKTLGEIAAYQQWIGDDRSTVLIDALAKQGITLPRSSFVFRADGDLIQLAALRAGLGIGICQVCIASQDARLQRVLPELGITLEAWIVMHEDLRRVPRVRASFDFLVGAVGSYYSKNAVGQNVIIY
jgi:DNA-binding transcriptional LysR family regulator